jgi:hypothetical protein
MNQVPFEYKSGFAIIWAYLVFKYWYALEQSSILW